MSTSGVNVPAITPKVMASAGVPLIDALWYVKTPACKRQVIMRTRRFARTVMLVRHRLEAERDATVHDMRGTLAV